MNTDINHFFKGPSIIQVTTSLPSQGANSINPKMNVVPILIIGLLFGATIYLTYKAAEKRTLQKLMLSLRETKKS